MLSPGLTMLVCVTASKLVFFLQVFLVFHILRLTSLFYSNLRFCSAW